MREHEPGTPNLKELARAIFEQALAECSIERSLERTMRNIADTRGTHLTLNGEEILALDRLKQIRIVSIGKAAAPMLTALLSRLPLPQPATCRAC